MSRLADIYKSEKTSGRGLGSTLGKATLEKIDPRKMFNQQGLMAAMLPSLFKAYSATSKSRNNTMSSRLTAPSLDTSALESQLTDIAVNTRLTAKNTMVLPMMARDANLTKLNIMKLVKLQGGKSTKSSDMFFKNAAAREKEYESKFSKEKSKTPSSSGGSPAAAGGAGGLKGIGLDFLSTLMGGLGKGLGIAAIGAGIGGFFAGLAAGGAAVTALGGAKGVKDMLVNLAEGLGAFSGQSMLAFGALLGAGMLFGPSGLNPVSGLGKGLNMSIGIASIGLGLGGFLAGLALGGAGIALLGGSGGVKTMMIDLAEGLNAFNPSTMTAFASLLGAGMLFGAVTGVVAPAGLAMMGGTMLGMTAIGLGLGGFLAGIALGGAAISALGGSGGVKQMMVNLAEGLNAFNPSSMTAFASLLGAGALFGVVTGVVAPAGLAMMGGTMLGMTAIGLGLGGFLAGLALGGKGIEMLGGGKGVKDMMVNLAEGLNAFGGLDAGNLAKLALAIPAFGVGLLGFFGLEGLAGIVKSFSDGMKGVTDWVFGNQKSGKTPMQQLSEDLKLFSNINGDNLSKIGQGFKDLASGLLGFAAVKEEDLARATKAAAAGAALAKNVPVTPSAEAPKTDMSVNPRPSGAMEARLRSNSITESTIQSTPPTVDMSAYKSRAGVGEEGSSPPKSPSKAPTALDITASTESGGRYDLAFGDVPKKDGTIVNILGKSPKNFPQLVGKNIMTPEQFSGKPLTEMTLAEVQAFQNYRNQVAPNTNAVGKYQFMRTTLFGKDGKSGLVGQSKLPMDTIFNANTQELLQATMREGNAATLRKLGVSATDANLNLANAVGAKGVAQLLKPENANRNALDVLGLTGASAETNPQLNKLSKDVIAATYSKYDARGMAPGGSSGTVLASTSTSVADQRMAAMNGTGGNTIISAPVTNVAQNSGGGGGNNVNPYNSDMAKYLLGILT